MVCIIERIGGSIFKVCSFSLEHMAHAQTPAQWHNFNPKHYGLLLGTAVFVFEGIGLVIPIYDGMDSTVRHRFPSVLCYTISFLVAFFCFFAGIVYASFGSKTESVVTLNLPNNGINGGTISVQLAYCFALVFTYPLMMYPALMILEVNYSFPMSYIAKLSAVGLFYTNNAEHG